MFRMLPFYEEVHKENWDKGESECWGEGKSLLKAVFLKYYMWEICFAKNVPSYVGEFD